MQIFMNMSVDEFRQTYSRFDNFTSKCSVTNVDIDQDHVATVDEIPEEYSSLQPPDCSIPFLHLTSDVLDSESLNLLKEESYIKSIFTELPVKSHFLCLPVFLYSLDLSYIGCCSLRYLTLILFRCLYFICQVLSEEEQDALAATPVHHAGLYGMQQIYQVCQPIDRFS